MESDDALAPRGYSLRSHGPVATDPASHDMTAGLDLAHGPGPTGDEELSFE